MFDECKAVFEVALHFNHAGPFSILQGSLEEAGENQARKSNFMILPKNCLKPIDNA